MTRQELRDAVIAAYGLETASSLAARLGITKNVVIGLWDRAVRSGRLKREFSERRQRAREAKPGITQVMIADRSWLGGTTEPRRVPVSLPKLKFMEAGE